jgi:hypothetical protein
LVLKASWVWPASGPTKAPSEKSTRYRVSGGLDRKPVCQTVVPVARSLMNHWVAWWASPSGSE